MKKSIVLAALVGLVCLVGGAMAQSYVDQILLVDVKSNGSAIHYFTRNPPLYWNFKGGPAQAALNTGTKALDIGAQWAPYNPDMGATTTVGAQLIAVDGSRPTCDATHRGEFYTVQTSGTGDAGVKDLTYQCCKAAAGTFSWVAVACQ